MLLRICKWVLVSALVVAQFFLTPQGATFTVENKCQYTVWPGISGNGISTTGFELQKGESRIITAPPSWNGRFWGRTLCAVNSTTRNFTCVTGDCGSGKVECSGGGPAPPTTFLEFSVDRPNGADFFDVSVVDGYNLPMLAVPQGDAGAQCSSASCVMDLNGFCPAELQVSDGGGEVVACKGPCLALRQDRYCCAGAYGTPSTCAPTLYSRVFKDACPRAYSYSFDDNSSAFTCDSGADYLISFCPSPSTSFGDYPSANLSTSWASEEEVSRFGDGSLLKPVLLNNSNTFLINNSSMSFPAVGCGFYGNASGYGENSISFVIFAIMATVGSTFTTGNPPKIIWSANRFNPVKRNATLQFTSEGDLVLRDVDGKVAWSTNTSGKSVIGMSINLAGNLMLYDSNSSIIWQSFDHPTETWLPGQKLSSGQRLIASASTTNWTAGPFYLSLSNSNLYAFIEATPPQIYGQVFQGGNSSAPFKNGRFNLIQDEANSTMVLYVSETNNFQYLRLDSDGHLRVYQWVEGVEVITDDILTGSLGDCAYPLSCGNYGICSNGQCTCPVGNDGDPNYFRQLDFRQPSLGCVEATQMSCQSPDRHHLLELDDVTYFEFVPILADIDVQSCKDACLKNCSCKAAVYRHNSSMSSGECSMPSKIYSLMNIQKQAVSYNSSTFIKVQKLPESPPTSSRKKANQILLIVGPILAATVVFAFFIFLYVRFKRNVLEDGLEEDGEWENSLVLLPNLPKRFSYEDLKSATQNFDVNKRLGGGGFGSVFEGTLLDGTRVAVKRLDRLGQGRKEFLAEVQTMGNIHHINLVKLLGFCAERSHRLLVYEYMSSGSLDKWIFHRTSEDALEWGIKKKIILNVAKGLAYLHEECKSRIIHLDIKPQNILLDENFNAKLSDFGLAKLMDRDQSQVMTQMRGTRGYLAPEWLSRKITEKADVYSFGVVMMEIVCGRRNLDYSAPEEAENLLEILKEKAETNELVDLVDKCNVNMQRHEEEAVELIRTAIWCLYADPARRPSMSTVVKFLEGATPKEHILDFSFFMPTTQAKSREDLVTYSAPQEASILSGPR
ncbi:hypothetical protein RJ640_007628 [Escallonia rubra]|uniref:non-specific serine/threonine protein kinase n=1 Tax=Escallonia rubra TaxID=112253 RepID=A0AA88UT66_9ASTE|nr:hypothetical protein RJ640_007628 [Escallonia rubra]